MGVLFCFHKQTPTSSRCRQQSKCSLDNLTMLADELHDYGAWRSLAHDERPREARAWNEEFQCLLESRNLSDAGNEVKRTAELRKLCEEFATVAKQIGKRIIEELFLPP